VAFHIYCSSCLVEELSFLPTHGTCSASLVPTHCYHDTESTTMRPSPNLHLSSSILAPAKGKVLSIRSMFEAGKVPQGIFNAEYANNAAPSLIMQHLSCTICRHILALYATMRYTKKVLFSFLTAHPLIAITKIIQAIKNVITPIETVKTNMASRS
jgi:hypothetical protein